MMKVECKKCGKIYTLEDGDNPEDYVCECGSELRKIPVLGDAIPIVLIMIVIQLFYSTSWVLLPFGIIAVIILWSWRNTARSEMTLIQKIFIVLVVIYILFIPIT